MARLLAGYVAALGYPGRGVTLLVTGDAAVRRLNARYRRRDRTTDILSFSYLNSDLLEGQPSGRKLRLPQGALLGELVVSYPRVKAQARAYGWTPRAELARLLAHGCVHLVGYDHPTRADDAAMRRIEERLLEAVGFPGLYP